MNMSFNDAMTAGLDKDFSGTLLDANNNPIAITAGSDVICKIYRGAGATPDLDLNGSPLTGGSKTTFVAGSGAGIGTWNVTLHGADTSNMVPTIYCVKVELVDAGDSNRVKDVDFGTMWVYGGVVGKNT